MHQNKIGISDKADICNEIILEKMFISALLHQSAKVLLLENNVKIYSNCYIGENVVIGDNSIIFSNVSIYHSCKIGKNNILHSGAVIGADGLDLRSSQEKKISKKISNWKCRNSTRCRDWF